MKKLIIVILIFILKPISNLYCDDFYLKIYYLNGERSEDSHSSEEYITIKGNVVNYSIFYTGTRGKYDIDTEKTCTFTGNNIDNIRNTIITGELTVNDSLIQEDTKYKSVERYCNITIDIRMYGNRFTIKINGDVENLHDKNLYNNSLFLISMIRDLLSGC